MSLAPGTRFGPYEVVAPLGAGGMGEVYRARDTRLDRTVAIKVLNSQLVASPELRGRFEREAKVISQLQHPNICVLHDVGCENGTDFLVMEFLEGEALSEKLKRGPLPASELLRIAVEVADALAKAHRAGIIHRDLKPGNVMLTKSGAKLLDFGLAKPQAAGVAAGGSSSASVFAAAMTMTSPASPLSSAGTIIGTVQYMAPEQIQGIEADARSDVFAFGLLLYEMATGKRAFEGKTQASIVGQILAVNPPPISSLQPMAPPALSRLVSTCLEKEPDERFQTLHDVKLRLAEMAEAVTSATQTAAAAPAREMNRLVWLATAAAVLALAAAAAYFASLALQPKQVVRSTLAAPDKTFFVTTPPDSGVPVLSPDGTRIAFVARDSKGQLSLYVRALNSLTALALAGTNGAIHPFWAPDSRNLAFFADGKLKRVDANGGPTQELAKAERGRGGAWSPDGTILFSPGINDHLMRVPAGGGTVATASKFAPGETGHRWPSLLPDGKHFVFWVRGDKPGICVGSLDSMEHKQILENATSATYAPPGYLLFVRDQTLMAQPFSVRKLATTGDAVPIAEHVAINSPSYRGVFSTSDNGMLVYQSSGGPSGWQLQWAGRDGKPLGSLAERAVFLDSAISPDGKRIATALNDGSAHVDIWILDVARGTRTRLTFDAATDRYPIWTPDGARIIYSSNRKGNADLYSKSADGSGSEEVLLHDDSDKTWKSISRDGRYLAYQRRAQGGTTGEDIWVLPLFGDRKPFPLVQTPYLDGTPAVSPDGKWMAYSSDENQRREIYIVPFPRGGAKWQVSNAGGLAPKWRGDGKELYFMGYDYALKVVDVAASANAVQQGTPHGLFSSTLQGLDFGLFYVTPDGKRFLLNGVDMQEGDTPLTLVTNWAAELKK